MINCLVSLSSIRFFLGPCMCFSPELQLLVVLMDSLSYRWTAWSEPCSLCSLISPTLVPVPLSSRLLPHPLWAFRWIASLRRFIVVYAYFILVCFMSWHIMTLLQHSPEFAMCHKYAVFARRSLSILVALSVYNMVCLWWVPLLFCALIWCTVATGTCCKQTMLLLQVFCQSEQKMWKTRNNSQRCNP